jgi:hypothetical protein
MGMVGLRCASCSSCRLAGSWGLASQICWLGDGPRRITAARGIYPAVLNALFRVFLLVPF